MVPGPEGKPTLISNNDDFLGAVMPRRLVSGDSALTVDLWPELTPAPEKKSRKSKAVA